MDPKVKKTVREVHELGAKDAKLAKRLLANRRQIKIVEDETVAKKKENNEALLELLDRIGVESIFDEDIGVVTLVTRITTTIKEEFLVNALRDAGLSKKKIECVLAASKETKESAPFITFKASNGIK